MTSALNLIFFLGVAGLPITLIGLLFNLDHLCAFGMGMMLGFMLSYRLIAQDGGGQQPSNTSNPIFEQRPTEKQE